MAVYFECRTRTKMPISELFDLARSIDAHKDSMRQSHEEAIDGVTSGLISLDEQVAWRAWHFGVPLQMTSRITEMQKPNYFVDEQVRGPFQRFRHVHEFSQDSEGTAVVDRVEFAAPFGPIGRMAEKLGLGRYLRRLIEARNRHLAGESNLQYIVLVADRLPDANGDCPFREPQPDAMPNDLRRARIAAWMRMSSGSGTN